MARRDSGRLTTFHPIRSRLFGVAAFTALVLGPATGRAVHLSEVRVGTHSDHTRIVFELDAPADYRMVSSGKSELVVALDAQSRARQVPSKSPLVRGVRVEPTATGSTVHIELAHPDTQLTEMILADPPRIVFDLARGEAPIAATVPAEPSKPEPAASAKPEPSAPVKPEPAAAMQPAPFAAAPEPIAAATPEPAAAPAPPATANPAAAPTSELAAVGQTDQPGAGAPTVRGDAATAPDAAHPLAGESAPAPPPPSAAPEAPAHRRMTAPAPPYEATESAGSSMLGLLMSPSGLLAVGVVLLGGIVLVVLRRRRSAVDEDPLYSVMSAEDAGAEPEAQPELPRWEARNEPAAPARDPHAFEAADDDDSYSQLPISRAGSAGSAAPASIFDREPPAGQASTQSASSPASGHGGNGVAIPAASAPPPAAASPAVPSHGETLRVAAEVEGRVAELERRLEQLAEARERLERQVAAQTEELRVQRAAIARTQRVVRSITKGEEIATEPVPRAPNA